MKLVMHEPGDPAIVFEHKDRPMVTDLLYLLTLHAAEWNKPLRVIVGQIIDAINDQGQRFVP